MAFFSKFFSRAERAPLPTLDGLLQARGIPSDLPGLEALIPDFEHLEAGEREAWADALAELHQRKLPLPPPWLDAQYDLLPQLAPAWQAEREGFHHRPYVEGLSERILVGSQLMPSAWLILWGIEEQGVTERAQDHLREKSKHHPFLRLPSGIYRSSFGDGLDASRMLLPELWRDLLQGQNTFVAVPTSHEMLVAPQVLLPKLVEAIDKALGSEHPRLQATIYQVSDSAILPANLQDPHPIAQPQRELRQTDVIHAYRNQEQDLDAASGVPGPIGLLHTQQGRSITFTIWTEGKSVVLPETDLIGFVDAKGKPLGLYFRQTMPRISELKGTAVDIWGPRRIRYEGFPTLEQLERLERFADGEQMAAVFKSQQASARPSSPPTSSIGAPPPLSQGSSPVPDHLRGQSLGLQSKD